MNILWIDRSSSRCGVCGKGADPSSKRHDKIMGFGPNYGKPGCGAEFTHVSTGYWGEEAEEATRRLRPDLPFVLAVSDPGRYLFPSSFLDELKGNG